jgi:cyclophilin family peptidyl-prolyl cis-trans isomerase
VLKISALVLTLAALAPFTQFGCPSAEPNQPATFEPRTDLTVSVTADAGTADVRQTVTLTAAVEDARGTLHYQWQQIAGLGVALTGAETAEATFDAPSVASATTLRFMVTVVSDDNAAGRAEVQVRVRKDPNYGIIGNPRPTAKAGNDQRVVAGADVTLDGSASKGVGLLYHWRQVSGPSVTIAAPDSASVTLTTPAWDPSAAHALVFELAVTDASARTVTDSVTVNLRDPGLSDTQVKFTTSLGDIIIAVDPVKAPLSAANFLEYVDSGFFDGTIFHRVIPNFVVQGGGYKPGLVAQTPVRDPIKNEANNGLKNLRGTLSMARTSEPDSATSQFFINLKNNIAGGDGTTNLDPGGVSADGYAVFGRVLQGMDVVDQIAAVDTETRGNAEDVPVTDVLLITAARVAKTDEIN